MCAIYKKELTKTQDPEFKGLPVRHCNFSSQNMVSHAHSSRPAGQKFKAANLWTQFCMAFSLGIYPKSRPTARNQKPFGSCSLSLLGYAEMGTCHNPTDPRR